VTTSPAITVGVVGGGTAVADHLASGLVARGAGVCLIVPPGSTPPTDGAAVSPLSWDMSAPDGLAGALAQAEERVGRIETTVWAFTEPASTVPAPLDRVMEPQWEVMAERPIRRYLSFLQGSAAYFAGRGGRVVALVPTLSMVGAPSGLVAWATAAEGQRALSKVAARNWGVAGITVNCLGVAPERLAWGDGDGDAVPGDPAGHTLQRAGLPPVSLARTPTLADDVSSVVLTLAGQGMDSVTGATIGVDGGVWMAP
jgi:NAD(P)-dependent dehydrogenase (short-subunit alcohol dehydrogenase family)